MAVSSELLRFGLGAFVTLLVIVDPFGIVPIFVGLTASATRQQRRAILQRAVLIALGISLFFLVAGRAALGYVGVSIEAFSISGGILLFATALPMLFGHRGGMQATESEEEGVIGQDISVFPLAIPLLSGPGVLTSILLLTARANGSIERLLALSVAICGVFVIAWVSLLLSDRVVKLIGEGGVHVATRVLGIILAALAVQYVLNGISSYYHLLTQR